MRVRATNASGGGGSATLLWTESHAGIDDYSFAPQTISLDLSAYSHILVECFYSAYQAPTTDPSYILVPVDGNTHEIFGAITANVYDTNFSKRTVAANSSGVTFGSGFRSGQTSVYNTRAYPYKIYGLNMTI